MVRPVSGASAKPPIKPFGSQNPALQAQWRKLPFSNPTRSISSVLAQLQSLVLVHVLRTGDWTCCRLMEERMVALDFRCDESRDLSDRCGSSMIFVNVQCDRSA